MSEIQFIISDVSAVTFFSFPSERSEVPVVCDFCQYYSASSCLVYLIGMLRADDETVPSVNNIIRCSHSQRSWDRRALCSHLSWLLPLMFILFQILAQKVYIL